MIGECSMTNMNVRFTRFRSFNAGDCDLYGKDRDDTNEMILIQTAKRSLLGKFFTFCVQYHLCCQPMVIKWIVFTLRLLS